MAPQTDTRFGVVPAEVVAVLSLLLLTLALAPRAEAFIYWPSLDSTMIGRSNLNGAGVDPGFITRADPAGVAVDADHIYSEKGLKKHRLS
jgi:hypothetical protein